MRPSPTVRVALCLALLLAACSRPSTPAGPAANAPAASGPILPPAPMDPAKAAILATLPAAYRNADLDNGQARFAACRSCHSLERGAGPGVGPNLAGVFGRKAGSLPGYAYSYGLKALGISWDADRINAWISGPQAMVPGTKMAFAGLQDPKDRIDVVAYLRVTTATPR